MATYIANHMIRHNGRLYQKGEEINTLSYDDAQELLKHRAITQFGRVSPKQKPAPKTKTAKRAPEGPAEPGGG